MKGDLSSTFEKNGKMIVRKLNQDREYISKNGEKINLHGRALLLNRNVGHLMTNPAILLKDGGEIQRGFWMHLYLHYVLYMISKIKKIREQAQFILLNLKCMDQKK